jgi:hypothetical protein
MIGGHWLEGDIGNPAAPFYLSTPSRGDPELWLAVGIDVTTSGRSLCS